MIWHTTSTQKTYLQRNLSPDLKGVNANRANLDGKTALKPPKTEQNRAKLAPGTSFETFWVVSGDFRRFRVVSRHLNWSRFALHPLLLVCDGPREIYNSPGKYAPWMSFTPTIYYSEGDYIKIGLAHEIGSVTSLNRKKQPPISFVGSVFFFKISILIGTRWPDLFWAIAERFGSITLGCRFPVVLFSESKGGRRSQCNLLFGQFEVWKNISCFEMRGQLHGMYSFPSFVKLCNSKIKIVKKYRKFFPIVKERTDFQIATRELKCTGEAVHAQELCLGTLRARSRGRVLSRFLRWWNRSFCKHPPPPPTKKNIFLKLYFYLLEDLSSTELDLTSIRWSESVNFRWFWWVSILVSFKMLQNIERCKTLQKPSISVDFCQAPQIIRWLSNQIEWRSSSSLDKSSLLHDYFGS